LELRVTETFANVFRRARRSARDPERGGPLTQERFAELLGQELRSAGTTATTVSNWERGRTQPHRHERQTVCALVTVLLRCDGLSTLDQANELLKCGGYAPLSQEEFGDGGMPATDSMVDANAVGEQNITTRSDSRNGKPRKLIAIRHQSMVQIPANAIQAWLPADLRDCEYIEITIDQCDLFHNGRLIDPYEAARRQHNLEARVAALLLQHPDAQIAYYGIAHIPLLFLAGYMLSNRRAIMLFENDRYTRGWDLLRRGGEAPPLQVTGLPEEVTWGAVMSRFF